MEGKRIGAFRWIKFADSVSGEVKKERGGKKGAKADFLYATVGE